MERGALLRAFGVFALFGFAYAVIINSAKYRGGLPHFGDRPITRIGMSRWPVGDCGPPRPLGTMHSVTLFPPLATPLKKYTIK